MNLVLLIWPKCLQGREGVQKAGNSAYVLNGCSLSAKIIIKIQFQRVFGAP